MKTLIRSSLRVLVSFFTALAIAPPGALAQTTAVLSESVVSLSTSPTPEVSTKEIKAILAAQSAWVFDARPAAEYDISHIPGALNVAQKPGTPTSEYISDAAEIERIVGGDKAAAIVLYCNGPFCGKTKRLAQDLLTTGFMNVKRYQAGTPTWRALGGSMQIEAPALRTVWVKDRTARFFDARPDTGEGYEGMIPHAIRLPKAEVLAAKDDGRLPMDDHNTRIICYGESGAQAKALADEITANAFHNVTFFVGSAEEFREAIFPESGGETKSP